MSWIEEDARTLSCWRDFRCIADRCRHSCCVGWEIDVDEDALRAYAAVKGPFGERLRRSIAVGDEGAFFALRGEDERCPFLNEKGLCDIILTLGEDYLCQICADHPRFRNYYDSCTELGFGLCCEEAARLLLWDEAPLELLSMGKEELPPAEGREERLFTLRQRLFELAQSDLPLAEKETEILRFCGASLPEKSPAEWAEVYRSLERLDSAWDGQLALLPAAQPRTLPERPLSRLLCYFLFRHLAEAEDETELGARTAFAVLSERLIALLWGENGGSEETLTELCRLYSSEIEYSDENLPALFELCAEG